jgi:calcineurin-like phosphoesterase family protein
MSEIYFTADLHLSDFRIFSFDERPFENVYRMDDYIISEWNKIVNNEDYVYIIGDVCYCAMEGTANKIGSLNGRKFLIRGNHDKRMTEAHKKHFEGIFDIFSVTIEGTKYIMNHYPLDEWERGAVHLHGHIHKNSEPIEKIKNRINVCMDFWDYKPVHYKEL